MESMIGRGRDAIAMIVDPDSFAENRVGCAQVPEGYGPGAVVGTASLNGRPVTILANDAQAVNPRFPVVYFGVIGMEEAYKMASAVYESILADRDKPAPAADCGHPGQRSRQGGGDLRHEQGHRRLSACPGGGAEGGPCGDRHGHRPGHQRRVPVPRPSGGSHPGLAQGVRHHDPCDAPDQHLPHHQNGHRAAGGPLPGEPGVRRRRAGVDFFYRLGGVEEIVPAPEGMRDALARHVELVEALKREGHYEQTGPWSRGALGAERGGRTTRPEVLRRMAEEFAAVSSSYLA